MTTNTNPSAQPVSDGELREKLAAIEHERWADWQVWVHKQLIPTPSTDPNFQIPKPIVRHWEQQILTAYEHLSEKEKKSDREQVDRYWPLIEQAVAQSYKSGYAAAVGDAVACAPEKRPYYQYEVKSGERWNAAIDQYRTAVEALAPTQQISKGE